jgi:hypothetical protein
MKGKPGKSHLAGGEKRKVEEALERKFFPRTYEKTIREKAMRDPVLFEERLKEKLRKCMMKK